MRNFLVSCLWILMFGSLSVVKAEPMAHLDNTPMLTKAAELHWVFVYREPVNVRNLMTNQERREYRHAMREAKTLEARQQIRELVYTNLQKRALEQGRFVVIPGSAAVHIMHEEIKPQIRESAVPEPAQTVPNTLTTNGIAVPKNVAVTAASPIQQHPTPSVVTHPTQLQHHNTAAPAIQPHHPQKHPILPSQVIHPTPKVIQHPAPTPAHPMRQPPHH